MRIFLYSEQSKVHHQDINTEVHIQNISITFFRGANLGGSNITISHDSFLETAAFMNSVASSRRKDILWESKPFNATFSLASSNAGEDESTPSKH